MGITLDTAEATSDSRLRESLSREMEAIRKGQRAVGCKLSGDAVSNWWADTNRPKVVQTIRDQLESGCVLGAGRCQTHWPEKCPMAPHGYAKIPNGAKNLTAFEKPKQKKIGRAA